MTSRPSPSVSPAPRRWRYLALGVVGVVFASAGLAAATFPRWGKGIVRDAVADRVAARVGSPVSIGSVDFDERHLALSDVSFDFGAGGHVVLSTIEVQIDPKAIWGGRVEVREVDVSGGSLRASEADLRALRERLGAPGEGAPSESAGRIVLRPRRVRVGGLDVELRSERMGGVGVRAQVDLEVDPEARAADVVGRSVILRVGERDLGMAKVSTRVSSTRDEAGAIAVVFPLVVGVEGAATRITPEISIAGASGEVVFKDPEIAEISVDLHGGFAGGGKAGGGDLWSIAGDLRRDLSAGKIDLDMAAFELGKVPQVLERLPLVDSERATVGGKVALAFADGKADVTGDLTVRGLNVNHPMLASDVVRGVGFSIDLAAKVDPAAATVVLERAVVKRDAVTVQIDGEFVHPAESAARRYRTHVRVPTVPCKDVLAAIPVELVPSLQGFELGGKFEMDVEANVDLADLERVRLGGKVGIDNCQVKSAPPRVAASRLGGPFTHRAVMRDGAERVVELQPGSGTFTPFAEISPYMVAAVLTTEDGGFWRHKGFLPSQFEAALRRNVEAGQIRLGASTITMQMVKNVLLSHERTLARKLQELFLTWYVERSLPKERIMEIYLNVIEFGPGVYGVTRAAKHYFGKRPGELTPPEAAYLALMLPTPVRRHVHYCEGTLDAKFKVKLRRILTYMNERGRLDAETYAAWKDAEITFDRAELGSKRECLAEIKRLLEASERQRARSGLLDEGPMAAPEDTAPGSFDTFFDDVDPAAADAPGRPASDDFFDDEAAP